jgi:hypothetical protein
MMMFKEHPDVQIPVWLLGLGFTDESWHHDACPKMVRTLLSWKDRTDIGESMLQSTLQLVVWVNFEEKERREVPDKWQVSLEINGEGVDWMPAGVYAGEDETVAIASVVRVLDGLRTIP